MPMAMPLAAVDLLQFAAQDRLQVRFREDFVFEFGAVAQFHEFVGVAGVAIAAGELATSVRVDAPGERHAGPGAVEHAAAGDFEVLDHAFGFQNFALGREAGDADQARRGRIAEQQHEPNIRLLFALVKFVVKGMWAGRHVSAVSLLAQDRSIVPLGAGGRRVALVIGNDSCVALEKLSNARNDARAVSDALRSAGFDVTTVTDGKLEDMDRGVDVFVKSIQPKDVALFYYSGLDEIQVKNRSLRASEVLERMEGQSAALRIVVLDSCRTNPFRSMLGNGAGGLATMGAGTGTFIAYASAPGQAASDNGGEEKRFTLCT